VAHRIRLIAASSAGRQLWTRELDGAEGNYWKYPGGPLYDGRMLMSSAGRIRFG